MGAILMQQGQPIAFLSQSLHGKKLALSTYEKEMLTVLLAVKKWRPYLLGQCFTILTDQRSLKYLLEQKISTPTQQKWLVKLLGFDFTVEYRKGATNITEDVLSCQAESMGIHALSTITPKWLNQLQQSYLEELNLILLLQQWNQG